MVLRPSNAPKRAKRQTDFALEEQLLAILRKTFPPSLARSGRHEIQSFTKFQVGMTIPDLMIISRRKSGPCEACVRRVPSLFECAVLAELLKRKQTRPSEVSRRLYAREGAVGKAINKLAAHGLLTLHKNGTVSARRQALLPVIKIVSVEAKLIRWKEAVQQARQYLAFSDSAYVALPEVLSDGHRIRVACSRAGVGLISVGPNNSEVVLKPRKRHRKYSPERLWLIHKANHESQALKRKTGQTIKERW